MTSEDIQRWLNKPAREVDPHALTRELDKLEAQVSEIETRLLSQRQELEELKADRDALSGFRNFIAHFSGAKPPTASRAPARKGSKRDAILVLLSDGAEWPTTSIRDNLVIMGLMANTDDDYHSLQVTLSRMFRKGELARPRQAVYQLPSAESADQASQAEQGVLDA